jgi:hypothetical protein
MWYAPVNPLLEVPSTELTCSDLISSDARLDYIADFDWDYLIDTTCEQYVKTFSYGS